MIGSMERVIGNMRIGHTIKISNIDNIENTPNIKTNTL